MLVAASIALPASIRKQRELQQNAWYARNNYKNPHLPTGRPLRSSKVVEDRNAGMTAGPGGGHEHIHCSLKLIDSSQVPLQISGSGARAETSHERNSGGAEQEQEVGGEGDQDSPPLGVVAAKYYFNGNADVVFRYRLYSFHACSVREQSKSTSVCEKEIRKT